MVLDMAKTRGWREGDNPARWRGHLENLLPKPAEVRKLKAVRHHPALPFVEIGAFMAELRNKVGMAARALELAIFYCCSNVAKSWKQDVMNSIWSAAFGPCLLRASRPVKSIGCLYHHPRYRCSKI